jgi:hypothetical protein
MDGIADLIGGGGRRVNDKALRKAAFLDHILEHTLRHGRAADVAKAYEHHSGHDHVLSKRSAFAVGAIKNIFQIKKYTLIMKNNMKNTKNYIKP